MSEKKLKNLRITTIMDNIDIYTILARSGIKSIKLTSMGSEDLNSIIFAEFENETELKSAFDVLKEKEINVSIMDSILLHPEREDLTNLPHFQSEDVRFSVDDVLNKRFTEIHNRIMAACNLKFADYKTKAESDEELSLIRDDFTSLKKNVDGLKLTVDEHDEAIKSMSTLETRINSIDESLRLQREAKEESRKTKEVQKEENRKNKEVEKSKEKEEKNNDKQEMKNFIIDFYNTKENDKILKEAAELKAKEAAAEVERMRGELKARDELAQVQAAENEKLRAERENFRVAAEADAERIRAEEARFYEQERERIRLEAQTELERVREEEAENLRIATEAEIGRVREEEARLREAEVERVRVEAERVRVVETTSLIAERDSAQMNALLLDDENARVRRFNDELMMRNNGLSDIAGRKRFKRTTGNDEDETGVLTRSRTTTSSKSRGVIYPPSSQLKASSSIKVAFSSTIPSLPQTLSSSTSTSERNLTKIPIASGHSKSVKNSESNSKSDLKTPLTYDTLDNPYESPYSETFKPRTLQQSIELKIHPRKFIKGYLQCFCMKQIMPGDTSCKFLSGFGRLCSECKSRVNRISKRNLTVTNDDFLSYLKNDYAKAKAVDSNPQKLSLMIDGGFNLDFKMESSTE